MKSESLNELNELNGGNAVPVRKHLRHLFTYLTLLTLSLASALSARAGETITATLTVTTNPHVSSVLSLGGTNVIWTNNTAASGYFVQTTNNTQNAATNLYVRLSLLTFTNVNSITWSNETNIIISGIADLPLTVTSSGPGGTNWATIIYSTNVSFSGFTLDLPLTNNNEQVQWTNIVDEIAHLLNFSAANVKVSAGAPLFNHFFGADAQTQSSTNKSLADGNLWDMTIVDPFLETSATIGSAGNFTFNLSDTFYVEFSEPTISGQLWNLKDGTTNPKDGNTIARYGDLLSDQFAFNTNSGAIYFKEGAQATNTFLETPHISGGSLSNDIRVARVKMVGSANDSFRFFQPDATTLAATISVNADGHPELEDTLTGLGLVPSIANPKELLSLYGLLQWAAIKDQVSGGPPTNWWTIPNYYFNPVYFSSPVHNTNAATTLFTGPLALMHTNYTGMVTASNNAAQLGSTFWTYLSGHSAASGLIGLRTGDGLPETNRLVGIVNSGSAALTLYSEAPGMEITNRFTLDLGQPLVLQPGARMMFIRDGVAQRWQPVIPTAQNSTATNVLFAVDGAAQTPAIPNFLSSQTIGVLATNRGGIGGTNDIFLTQTNRTTDITFTGSGLNTNVLNWQSALVYRMTAPLTTNGTLIISNPIPGQGLEIFLSGAAGSVIASNYTITVRTNGSPTATRLTWLSATNGSFDIAVRSNKFGVLKLKPFFETNIVAEYKEEI